MSHPTRLGTYSLWVILVVLVIAGGNLWALDEFSGVKCGTDIAKQLVGKRSSNEAVAAVEGRHKDLNLKNLGGTEISDTLFLASWQICGSEYEVLLDTKTNLVRDAMSFPRHSTSSPMFIGKCHIAGKKLPTTVVAVLDNSAGLKARDEKSARSRLKASGAWKIDQSKQKFVKEEAPNLDCPLDGIVTQDGGP
jgi:hypothetical protein